MKRKRTSIKSFTMYLPIAIILLSITIMVGSTLAYFSDKVDTLGQLTFGKVELSSDTTVGVDGELFDVIPGSKIINGEVAFSKAIDSNDIYVRAKLAFSLPDEFVNDTGMQEFVKQLRNATDFNIIAEEQNGAVWSEKQGNYFYLLNADDTSKLKVVNDINAYVLSNDITIPRSLTQLEDNAQYMKSINFHIAFEAIQADNVEEDLDTTKVLFDEVFPTPAEEKPGIYVSVMNSDLMSVKEEIMLVTPSKIEEPEMEDRVDEDGTTIHIFDAWYLDSTFTTKFDFDSVITTSISLYPHFLEVSEGLVYEPIYESATSSAAINNAPDFSERREGETQTIIGYSVAQGSCSDAKVLIPQQYMGKPVTTLVANAFKNNANITEVRLPKTINNLNTYAFSSCQNLTTINLQDTAVEAIGERTFNSCLLLDEVKFPDSVKSVGPYAFYNCNKLTDLQLSNNITNIANNAFYQCELLTDIVLPSKLTNIGNSAFAYTNLGSVEIPKTVTNIGDNPFYFCSNISLSVQEGNTTFKVEEECLININSTTLICGSGTSIPSGVTIIGKYAFEGNEKITNIVIPEGVKDIKDGAFACCSNVTSITIPESVKSIGGSAFNACPILTEVNYNAISVSDLSTYLASGSFHNSGLEGDGIVLNVGANVKKIPSGLFYDNYYTTPSGRPKLVEVKFAEGSMCESIGSYAFNYCEYLKAINIPNSVNTIDNFAFSVCLVLENITLPSSLTNIGKDVFKECRGLKQVIIPEGVKTIGDSMFNTCMSLESVSIPQSLTTIQDSAFWNCYELNNIVLHDGITTIGVGVFGYCRSLENIYMPKDVTIINNSTFNGCESLKSITINENVVTLGKNAFTNCISLTEINFNAVALNHLADQNDVFVFTGKNGGGITVNIGNKVTRIPNNLFYPDGYIGTEGPNITAVNFEDDSVCTSIGNTAFGYCVKLTSLVLPKSITTIGVNPFAGCMNLTLSFSEDSSVYKIENNCLIETATNTVVSGFKGAVIPDYIQKIGRYAFHGMICMTSVTIPASVTSIETQAFRHCYKLVEVINLSTINIQAKDALYVNGGVSTNAKEVLTSADSSKIVTINGFEFYDDGSEVYLLGCNNITENLVLPESYNGKGYSVYDYAFANCQQVKSLTINTNVTSIETHAFYNMTELTEINYKATSMEITSSYYYFDNAGVHGDGITLNIANNVTAIPYALFDASTDFNPKIIAINFESGSVCKEIESYAFDYVKTYEELILPDSIEVIGKYAFTSAKIKKLVLSNNLTTIKDYAFAYCYDLNSILLPNSITTIEKYALYKITAYILCDNETVGQLAKNASSKVYVKDVSTNFDGITFTDVDLGDVNGSYSDGSNDWVRTGESGNYTYYKKY